MFAALPLVELSADGNRANFPTAVAAYGDQTVLGTNIGTLQLIVNERGVETECVISSRKRPVRQVALIGSAHICIALCDGIVSVHDIKTLNKLCDLNNAATKAETFVCNAEEAIPRVCLSVASQHSLLFFRLANPVQLYRELRLKGPPARMVWAADFLSIASISSLTVTDTQSGHAHLEHPYSVASGASLSGALEESRSSALAVVHENQRCVAAERSSQQAPIHASLECLACFAGRYLPFRGFASGCLLPGEPAWCEADTGTRLAAGLQSMALPAAAEAWDGEWTLDRTGKCLHPRPGHCVSMPRLASLQPTPCPRSTSQARETLRRGGTLAASGFGTSRRGSWTSGTWRIAPRCSCAAGGGCAPTCCETRSAGRAASIRDAWTSAAALRSGTWTSPLG